MINRIFPSLFLICVIGSSLSVGLVEAMGRESRGRGRPRKPIVVPQEFLPLVPYVRSAEEIANEKQLRKELEVLVKNDILDNIKKEGWKACILQYRDFSAISIKRKRSEDLIKTSPVVYWLSSSSDCEAIIKKTMDQFITLCDVNNVFKSSGEVSILQGKDEIVLQLNLS